MSEYLQELFADLPEAVRHAVVLQLQQVVQQETLIATISTNLGAAGNIVSHLPTHANAQPPVPINESLASTLHGPESSTGYAHTCAERSLSDPRHSSQDCPPLLTDPDAMRTSHLLNACTALKKKLLLCRTSTRLWDLYMQAHHCTTWNQVSLEMIDAFARDAAYILHDPMRHPLSSVWDRFTGGFEAMLQGVLGVTASLWGAPLTTMSAAFHTPVPQFRAFSTIHSSLDDTLQQHESVFLRSNHHPSPSLHELKILDDRLRSPLPLRCVVLPRRDVSETWNAWVSPMRSPMENWAEKGRAHLLFATQTMKVRRFHPTQAKEQWQFLEGPWEMYIIEARSVPLGSRVDEAQLNDALQGFTRCKKYQFEYYPLPAHTHTPSTGFLQHDEFWRQWDDIAHARAQLLAQFPCPWDSVAATLMQSNRLLLKCPDRRLRRIARLSQLADFEDLNEEDRFIDVICGPFAPYVGQTGRITTARSLMQRYKEHLRRAKALNKHFQGPKRRRYRKLFAFGKLPSLERLLARNGPAPATIFPLQKVRPDTHGGQPERWWVRVLAPTLNKVLPFGGTDRLRWEALLQQKQPTTEYRTLTAWIQDIVNAQGQGYSAEHALALATEAVGHVGQKLFERFFHCVQILAKAEWGIPLSRRMLGKIPCYDEEVIKQVQYVLKRSLFSTSLPLVVSTWYAQALTVLPDSADSMAAATRPMTRPSTPLRVARLHAIRQPSCAAGATTCCTLR